MIDSAVILAVSASTHSSEISRNIPRAMLPALGKPMVIRVMDRLYRAGIRQYTVIVGLSEGEITSYLHRQWMPDAHVEFALLQAKEPLAPLLSKIARKLDRPFLVGSYNIFSYDRFMDSFIREHDEYPEALLLTGARMTLSALPPVRYAVTNEEGRITDYTTTKTTEKTSFVLADQAIFGEHFVEYLKKDTDKQSPTLFDLVRQYQTQPDALARIARTSWLLEVTSDNDLLTLNKHLLDDLSDSHILSELPYTVKIIPPVRIDPQVSVGQGAVLGPHVYVQRGASIGYGAKLRNSLVLSSGNVPANADLDGAIVTTRTTIQIP